LADTYRSFDELRANEVEDSDWSREYQPRGSTILVMAPHGGWIEPHTTELARSIAGDTFSFYTFQGLKGGGNQALHITSHRFDEPVAMAAVGEADHVVAIHGERSRHEAFVMVGGAERGLAAAVAESLADLGFKVSPPRPGLGGLNPRNICNRGRQGAGIQLELSEGLRQRLRDRPAMEVKFVEGVRKVLRGVEGVGKGEE
jgi:phage replication-related protein YjqB (UPF0714/DUF867 family)